MTDWNENKAKVLARLRRAEGQLRAVISMVDSEDDCERIAQQLSAARKALDRAFYDMVACMMRKEFDALGLKNAQAKAQLAHMSELLARYG
jgi:DNA-binding FrmR family transcriptional regulator